jgi:hypothetical protein
MALPTTRIEARKIGSKFYLNDSLCKRGHLSKKYTSDGGCSACAALRAKARYSAKRPEILAKLKESYAADPDAKKARVAKRRLGDPEKIRAESCAEYQRNKAKYVARARKWVKSNRVKYRGINKEWRERNPDKVYQVVVLRRMRKAQRTPPWLTPGDFEAMRNTYIEARRLSIETGVPHQVDHVIPLWGVKVSGLHVPSNLQILTALENRSKSNNFP